MNRIFKSILLLIITLMIFTGCVFTEVKDHDDTTQTTVTTEEKTSLQFRKHSYLTQHFEKHGDEMGCSSEEEYLSKANEVINNPNALTKTEAEDGDMIYYIEDTNEIVFVSTDGYIRTYFRCKNKAYFDRQ